MGLPNDFLLPRGLPLPTRLDNPFGTLSGGDDDPEIIDKCSLSFRIF